MTSPKFYFPPIVLFLIAKTDVPFFPPLPILLLSRQSSTSHMSFFLSFFPFSPSFLSNLIIDRPFFPSQTFSLPPIVNTFHHAKITPSYSCNSSSWPTKAKSQCWCSTTDPSSVSCFARSQRRWKTVDVKNIKKPWN